MSIATQPRNPAEWKDYATSEAVSDVPAKVVERVEGDDVMKRNVYLEATSAFQNPAKRMYIFTDVLAFTNPSFALDLPEYGIVQIVARVITADAPIKLRISPGGSTGCLVWIYASILDQAMTVEAGNSSTVLALGTGSDHVGVQLNVFPDTVRAKYETAYLKHKNADLQAHLETQLRVSLALFWRSTSIAVSLCSYVASVTSNPALYPQLNMQAIASGQQLAAKAMTGPDMSYAPILVLDSYKETVREALAATAGFERQYDRFMDQEAQLEIQKQAWDTMLQQAINERGMREVLRDSALSKYETACDTVTRCHSQLKTDEKELEPAKDAFLQGLEEWVDRQKLNGVFGILQGIIGFAKGIGALCYGDMSGIEGAISAVDSAITAAKKAEIASNQTGVIISSRTLEILADCMKALEKVYPNLELCVQAAQKLEDNPDADIPAIGDISGSSNGDADAAEIVALAAWDRWVLESDQQLEFAVNSNIRGASLYRLALRKHAVNGKQLAQAQAEAIKAGQQYIHAVMDVILSEQDIEALKALRKSFDGLGEVYDQARAKFFDRFLAMRTSLVVEMRNMIWAFRYWALEDSKVVLDSQKLAADFQADLYYITREVETANESYSTDFQPFEWTVPSKKLPSNYHETMLEGLKGPSHRASFTLAPRIDPADGQDFASVFVDGSHFRLDGLETVLRGVLPQPDAIQDGVVQVDIQISTSGVYSDVRNGKVFHFTSVPRSVRFSYELTEDGQQGSTGIHATFPTEYHAEPTPFTQWTIQLLHPEVLDLTGLTGVDLMWKGHASFDSAKRMLGSLRI